MSNGIPAISGVQLMRLLEKDGWRRKRYGTHGFVYVKAGSPRSRVTVVPNKSRSLPARTLADILGEKQTGLGRSGLLSLIKKYGL